MQHVNTYLDKHSTGNASEQVKGVSLTDAKLVNPQNFASMHHDISSATNSPAPTNLFGKRKGSRQPFGTEKISRTMKK